MSFVFQQFLSANRFLFALSLSFALSNNPNKETLSVTKGRHFSFQVVVKRSTSVLDLQNSSFVYEP
jgi:hypothetical protein